MRTLGLAMDPLGSRDLALNARKLFAYLDPSLAIFAAKIYFQASVMLNSLINHLFKNA